MLDILNSNIGFTIIAIAIIVVQSIVIWFHQSHLDNLKESIADLEKNLLEEDAKISGNFDKIHNNLSLMEREINHAINVAEHTDKKDFSSFKPMGKKAKKFLTPKKGKIKKQYADHPLAQKCYQKFHNLQSI